MKRKESKIPLLLTLIVLGYFVFWAIGYVARNKPQPVPTQPVVDLAKPANITETPSQPVSNPTPLAMPPEPNVQVAAAPKPATDSEPVQSEDNDSDVVGGKHIQNRKLLGIAKDTTNRH